MSRSDSKTSSKHVQLTGAGSVSAHFRLPWKSIHPLSIERFLIRGEAASPKRGARATGYSVGCFCGSRFLHPKIDLPWSAGEVFDSRQVVGLDVCRRWNCIPCPWMMALVTWLRGEEGWSGQYQVEVTWDSSYQNQCYWGFQKKGDKRWNKANV